MSHFICATILLLASAASAMAQDIDRCAGNNPEKELWFTAQTIKREIRDMDLLGAGAHWGRHYVWFEQVGGMWEMHITRYFQGKAATYYDRGLDGLDKVMLDYKPVANVTKRDAAFACDSLIKAWYGGRSPE